MPTLTNLKRTGHYVLVIGTIAGISFAADEIRRTGTPNGWRQHELSRPKPPRVEPSALAESTSTPAPTDAVVLFDGKNLDSWQSSEGGPAEWAIKDGALVVTPGKRAIRTRESFGDVQLHVEWASPNPARGKGQDRGNSGIFLMGVFELQVLDSYKAETYADGQAGAIYGQFPPLYNASRPPGEWQTYDIAFRRPLFDSSGKLLEPARVTLIHNGVLVQNNEEFLGPTNWLKWMPYDPSIGTKGPIELQDHSHPVRFRNIWLRKLPERPAPTASDLKRAPVIQLSQAELDRFVGAYEMGQGSSSHTMVDRVDDHLTITLPFRKVPLEARPVAPMVFVLPDTDAKFTFLADKDGQITGARFQIADGDRTLRKVKAAK